MVYSYISDDTILPLCETKWIGVRISQGLFITSNSMNRVILRMQTKKSEVYC